MKKSIELYSRMTYQNEPPNQKRVVASTDCQRWAGIRHAHPGGVAMVGFAALAILGGCSAGGDSSSVPCDSVAQEYDECGECTVRPEDATVSEEAPELAYWSERIAAMGRGGLESGVRAPQLLVTASDEEYLGVLRLREWRGAADLDYFTTVGAVVLPSSNELATEWRQGSDSASFILTGTSSVYTAPVTGTEWEITEHPEFEALRWLDIEGDGTDELVGLVYDDAARNDALTDSQDFYLVDDVSRSSVADPWLDLAPQSLGDVDGDGIRDVALRGQDSNWSGSKYWSEISILRGPLESGVTSDQISGVVRKQWISSYHDEDDVIAEAGDADGDGRDDLLLTFSSGAKASSYLLFAGESWWSSFEEETEVTGTFEAVDREDDPYYVEIPDYAIGHLLSDLTGDGSGEIVIQQGSDREYPSGLFYGPFSGVRDLYAPDELYPSGNIATGDWDLDGVDDVVVGIRETERLYFWSGGGVGLYR